MAHFLLRAKRPWRKRIWFYRPGYFSMYVKPWYFGNDEYHWKTIVLGWVWTGQIVIATKPFGHGIDCYDLEWSDIEPVCLDAHRNAEVRGWEY